MRLDPKYFNTFLAIVAVIAALFIAYYTISSQQNRQVDFKERIKQQDSLRTVYWSLVEDSDSLRISDFDDRYVVLNFWSGWSGNSIEAHRKLATLKQEYDERVVIIAAAVGLRREEAISYIRKQSFPFYHVAGSQQFSSFGVPGVPAYLLYTPADTLGYVSLGTLNDNQIDSLRAVIDGKTN